MAKINIRLEMAKEVEHKVIDKGLELNATLREAKEMYKGKAPNQTDQSKS